MFRLFSALIFLCMTQPSFAETNFSNSLNLAEASVELSNPASYFTLSKDHQQAIVNLGFDKDDKFNIVHDVQACQSRFQACFNHSDCCAPMVCREHSTAGWVCY